MFGFLKKKEKAQASLMTACADGKVIPMSEAKGYCMEVMQIVMDSEEAAKIQFTTGMEGKAGETVVASW